MKARSQQRDLKQRKGERKNKSSSILNIECCIVVIFSLIIASIVFIPPALLLTNRHDDNNKNDQQQQQKSTTSTLRRSTMERVGEKNNDDGTIITTTTDGRKKYFHQKLHQQPKKVEQQQQQQQQQHEQQQPYYNEGRLIEFEVANLDHSRSSSSSNTTGWFVVWTRPSWSPLGAERFERLTTDSYWKGCFFFRAIPNFMTQFGINPNVPKYDAFPDEPFPHGVTNRRGTITFAMSGKNTRTSQVYINTKPKGNAYLDKQGFLPFGMVVRGMDDVVDRIYNGYGEGAPSGKGPRQNLIWKRGNSYLEEEFPLMSYIVGARFIDVEEFLKGGGEGGVAVAA